MHAALLAALLQGLVLQSPRLAVGVGPLNPPCRHAIAPLPHVTMMAGFGGGAKPSSKASKGKGKSKGAQTAASKRQLSPKRQWDVHTQLVKDGATQAAVHAYLPPAAGAEGDGQWLEVGTVSVGAGGTLEQAARLNKRFILEHAVRLNPALTPRSKELQCGLSAAGKADAPPSLLAKGVEVPDDLVAGFCGTPHPPSGYYVHYDGAAADAFVAGSSKRAGRSGGGSGGSGAPRGAGRGS